MQAASVAAQGLGPSNPLSALEQALGISQHHDAISGTATQAVNDDYLLRLEAGRAGAYASIAASLANLTGYADAPFTVCPLSNVSICPALETGSATVAIVHNSLGQDSVATSPVRLVAGFPPGVASYAVLDAQGAPVVAQVRGHAATDSDAPHATESCTLTVPAAARAAVAAGQRAQDSQRRQRERRSPVALLRRPLPASGGLLRILPRPTGARRRSCKCRLRTGRCAPSLDLVRRPP